MQSLKSRVVMTALTLCCYACADEGPTIPSGPQAPEIPAPTSPENLVRAVEVIFNDTVRSASERLREYSNLFAPDFEFHDPPPRYPFILEEARGLFEGQESGDIYSLRASIVFKPAADLDPPEPGRENWKVMFASNIGFRLLMTPSDGYEENGGQAMILAYPTAGGSRWFIAEWFVLPRPRPIL